MRVGRPNLGEKRVPMKETGIVDKEILGSKRRW